MPLPYEGISPVLEALAKEIALTHPRLMPDDWWPELITISATHHVDGWENLVGIQACVDAFLNDFDPEDSRARAHEFQLRAIRLAMWQALEDRRLHPEKHKPQAIDGDGISGHVWNGPRDACARCSATRKEFEDDLVPKVCVGDSSWRDDLLTDALRERNDLRDMVAVLKRENSVMRVYVDATHFASAPLGLRRVKVTPEDLGCKPLAGAKADMVIIDDPHKPDDDSPEKRANTMAWFLDSVPDRQGASPDGPIVVIKSRLYGDDGVVLPEPGTDAYMRIGLEKQAAREKAKAIEADARAIEEKRTAKRDAAVWDALDFDWSALRALRKGAGY